MKRIPAVFFFLLFLASGMTLQAGERHRGWFVEGSFGFALLDPEDLNARAEAQGKLTAFNYSDYFEWAQRTANGAFMYALEASAGSDLRRIREGFPVSMRIGRAVSRRIAFFAGLQWLDRRRTSTLLQKFSISDLRPGQVTPGDYTTEITYPDYFLAARAWIPHLGVEIDMFQIRSWTAGIRLSAGPMFASLRTIEERRVKKTDSSGYWTESWTVSDMKGKGTGVAAEAVARLQLPVSPRLGLNIEAGYALRTGLGFSGPGFYEYQYRDANAASDPIRMQWEEGEWRTRRLELHRSWGDLEYVLSGNDLGDNSDTGKFRLDLSGWQLAVGLVLVL